MDLDLNNLLANSSVSIIVGTILPFLLPFLYKLINKIGKFELNKEEKRLINSIIAVIVAVVVIMFNYKWSGVFKDDFINFCAYFILNFVSIKGSIQAIYEELIKKIEKIYEN